MFHLGEKQDDCSDNVLSTAELCKYRNSAVKSLPSRGGQKDSGADGSLLQAKKLETHYGDLAAMLSEERVERSCAVVVGEWNPNKHLVEFNKELGKFWIQMGFADCGRKWLYPEEALYLMETKVLEVYYQGLPVSIQEAYATFVGAATTLEEYQVYAHLRRLGYVLQRYVPRPSKGVTVSDNTKGCTNTEVCENVANCKNATILDDVSGETAEDTRHNLCIYQKDSDVSPSVNRATNLPHTDWNYNKINLPDMAGSDVIELGAPKACLLPEGIDLRAAIYTVDVDKISADSLAKRRKRRDDCEFPDLVYSHPKQEHLKRDAKNWSDYKRLLEENRRGLLEAGHLWSGEVTPLLAPHEATSYQNVVEKSQIIPRADYTDVIKNQRFRISYDVHLPNNKFKKTDPGEPTHRVCVASLYDSPPSLHDLYSLHTNDSIPLLWAVISEAGELSFMSMQPVNIFPNSSR